MHMAKGFTLLEVLVAIAVFSTAILAVGRMQITASQVSTAAGRLSRATALAQDTAEHLMGLAYSHELLRDQTPTGQTTSYTGANAPTGYTVTWNVDDDELATGVKTVNVMVSWRNRDQPRTFSLAFYKAS
ncbi:MAG: prepilin-type N-terminal cleavage/methylation domain-containing protein [Candidatus Tectimicrobiota bacterium]